MSETRPPPATPQAEDIAPPAAPAAPTPADAPAADAELRCTFCGLSACWTK